MTGQGSVFRRGGGFRKRFEDFRRTVSRNRFSAKLLKGVDWYLLTLVVLISLFGVVSIFAATGVPMEKQPESFLELLQLQPTSYPRLQLLWLGAGLVAMCVVMYFSYEALWDISGFIYLMNIGLLLILLLSARAGRGNMKGWFDWGNGRTFQPSEIAKLSIIISLAKFFANRKKPIKTISNLIPVVAYLLPPLLLIVAQPDFGTAMVYIAIFAVLLFTSGISFRLLGGLLFTALLLIVPLIYYLTNVQSDNFRLMRILSFIDPSADLNASLQVTNAKTAIGSAGLLGKGLFQEGSYALLNYIPDDYTDFIFSIVGESFGLVGAGLLVLAYLLLIIRLVVLSSRAGDAFGSYMIIGIMAMYLFHIFENISMVIGLMPVTGIPLPFVSYGGSNMLTNFIGIGIVLNVYMRRNAVRDNLASIKPSVEI